MNRHTEYDCDVLIAGGGLVGGSLAVALADSGIRVIIVEPFAADSSQQPSYDERTVALTYSSKDIYSELGVWEHIWQLGAEPIRDIHISNRGHFGMTHLSATEMNTDALGYVVPTRVIGKVISDRINAADNIEIRCPASATNIETVPDAAHVAIEADGQTQLIRTRLAVIADGGRSVLAEPARQGKTDYPQQALLTIVSVDRPHNGRAYERFTEEGPIALLPHGDLRYAVVWTSSPEQLTERMAMSDEVFIVALQEAFGDRAGTLSHPSPRKSYPLSRGGVENPVSGRSVTIGNAAHIVHPVAGQGFNLGLRDVATLAALLLETEKQDLDPGSNSVLDRYAAFRHKETSRVQQFTHGLISLFSNQNPVVGLGRNLAMSGIEALPIAKRFLLRRTMGLHAKRPRLRKIAGKT